MLTLLRKSPALCLIYNMRNLLQCHTFLPRTGLFKTTYHLKLLWGNHCDFVMMMRWNHCDDDAMESWWFNVYNFGNFEVPCTNVVAVQIYVTLNSMPQQSSFHVA